MEKKDRIVELFQKMVGEETTVNCSRLRELNFFEEKYIGYSQFNEILLLLGFDRVTQAFFQFIVDQNVDYVYGSEIKSIEQLEKGINEFRKMAVLLYANVKFGFKSLAQDSDELKYQFSTLTPLDVNYFKLRHSPILEIQNIDPEETYLLGYKIRDQLLESLKEKPDDLDLLALEQKRLSVIDYGKRNQIAYLTSDHLDVYVATSMRLKHEYINVSQTVRDLMSSRCLQELSLRIFDPTQAYCDNRIDKGLSEGLMLKRAKCTVYLVQESDTLGKDSELASTLAQGKPVIAIVPLGDEKYVDDQIKIMEKSYPEKDKKNIIIELLKLYDASLAWRLDKDGENIRYLIGGSTSSVEKQLLSILYSKAKKHYDDRYKTLVKSHPLGLQVDLDTGVATGVLVVRDTESCAKLIRSHILKSVEYEIKDELEGDTEYTYLIEKQSQCVFRVITGDKVLSNSFWNFYFNVSNN